MFHITWLDTFWTHTHTTSDTEQALNVSLILYSYPHVSQFQTHQGTKEYEITSPGLHVNLSA